MKKILISILFLWSFQMMAQEPTVLLEGGSTSQQLGLDGNILSLTGSQSVDLSGLVGGIVASGSIEIGEESSGVIHTVTHSLGYIPDASRINIIYSDQVSSSPVGIGPKITSITSTQFSFTLGSTIGTGNDLYAFWTIFGSDISTPLSASEIESLLDTYYGNTDWRTGGGTPTTDASELTTGVLADPRVQESNVTQHQASLSITESQISDLSHTVDTDDQNASEVPYTNNGQTTTEGALDDLYSSTVSFSGIDHTDDFTISDTDIGKVHNIIINAPDSIVVTYPNNLTVFGFTKFVVKGTGFVAFDMDDVTTTRGSFKTPSGRGESSTVRNYSATEADVLNASQLLAYVPAPAIPPTLLNAGTMSVASLTPTIDVAYPTVSNGDYMLLHIVTRANGVVLNTGITTPDGWSLIHYEDEATESSGTSSFTHAVYGRFSDGSQTGNLTVSFTTNNPNSSTARISTWGGVNVSNPFNLIGDGILGTYDLSTTGIPIPAVTTTNGTTAIAMIGFNDTLALTQAPTNYTTQVYDEGTSAGSDSRIGAWYIPINADGSIGADSAKYSTTLIAEGIVIQLNGQ